MLERLSLWFQKMSSLQLGLIVAGIVLVIGVILYNAWLERRMQRRIADARRKDPTQVIAAPTMTSRREPTLGSGEATVGAPAARSSPAGGSKRNIEPPSEAFAIPMDDVRGVQADTAEIDTARALESFAGQEPATHGATAAPLQSSDETAAVGQYVVGARPDPDIECVITLQSARPIHASTLIPGLHARLGKPLRWFGRTASGVWHLLAKDSQGSFHEVAACLLLADRNGAVSRGQLEGFARVVADLAPTLPAAYAQPAIDEELERAEALDKLCAEVDVQVGLTVVKTDPSSIPGTRLRGVAEAAGFKLAPSGRFEFVHDETGSVLYSLLNLKNEPFTTDSLRLTATQGVVLLLDVPRVPDPIRVFDQMKLVAKRLALTLGGEVVDDNRRVLDDASLARTREQVEEAANALREVHIEPGSARALALFNA